MTDSDQPTGAAPGGDPVGNEVTDGAEGKDGATQLPAAATHRRAPRYGRFILAGILLAGLVAFATTMATGDRSELTPGNLYLVLLLYLIPAGVLAGALTALILDRRSLKRAERQRSA